ncbi:hypothetical protein GCM10010428_45160 [Actinosynnema pretiosum subsp. pretiosum]
MGEHAVKGMFLTLGWGTASAPEHDVGTDLWVMVRAELFDLGLMLGAQVKTGPSYFSEPECDEAGEIVGWWFRDSDRRHVDYWLTHVLPHLLVLHDLDTGVSYWVQVTEEAVVSTGKGAKILVPRASTLDLEHRDALRTVAATVRRPARWEGSAWSGAASILPRDLLRYALITPRLVAPHRNAGPAEPIGPAQAVALIVEARQHELEGFIRRHPEVPDFGKMADSPEWGWRFAAAVDAHVRGGGWEALIACIGTAATPYERSAAAAAAAAALVERAQPERALRVLDEALAHDDNAPVDRAWLTVQRARARLELGSQDQAREDAVSVQSIGVGNSEDVTATAIAGAATQMVFRLADWSGKDVAGVISGLDTFSVWWRSQRVSSGAAAVIDREFTAWSRDRSLTFHAEDVPHNRLLAAALMASHAGDHSAWRLHASQNARQQLLQVEHTTDPDRVGELLDILRFAGDDKTLGLAARRLVTDGPAQAVSAAAARIDFAALTHTTSLASLMLLRRGGDVLDGDTASRAVRWLLRTMAAPRDPSAAALLGVSADKLVDALAGVVPAAPLADQQAVLEQVVSLPPQHDAFMVGSCVRLVRALPVSVWTGESAARATAGAAGHDEELRLALLSAAAPLDEAAGEQLLTEIRQKQSLDALVALNPGAGLPDEVAAELIGMSARRVLGVVGDAAPNSFIEYVHDVGRILAVLNLKYPAFADWEPIYALLAEPLVVAKYKAGTCFVLAGNISRLSEEVRGRLAGIVGMLLDQPANPMEQMLGKPDLLGPAARLATALGQHFEVPANLGFRLLSGTTEHRVWAALLAEILSPSTAVGMLAALAQDIEPQVRAHAAAALTRLAASGASDPLIEDVLRCCLADSGTFVHRAMADALAGASPDTAALEEVRRELAESRSAEVRAMISSG